MPYVHVDGKYSTNLQSLQRRRKLTAECGCMITYTISINIVRFERIVSGRFSPLTAPLPRPPAPLRRIFSSPAHPVFGPALLTCSAFGTQAGFGPLILSRRIRDAPPPKIRRAVEPAEIASSRRRGESHVQRP